MVVTLLIDLLIYHFLSYIQSYLPAHAAREQYLHQYEQLKEELRLHADKTKKYIVFHDTTLYAVNGEFGGSGIWPAVQEFMDSHSEWELVERKTNNNGLTILKRV